MARLRYGIRAYFIVSVIIGSFLGGLKLRRSELEADLASARCEAAAALREKENLEVALKSTQLALQLTAGRARRAEFLAGLRRKDARGK